MLHILPSTEQELLQKLSINDLEAREYIYDQYAAPLLGLILKTIPEQNKAEILLLRVFKSFFNNIEAFMGKRLRLYVLLINHTSKTVAEYHQEQEAKVKPMKSIGNVNQYAIGNMQ